MDNREETLDPESWDDTRVLSQRIVNEAIDYLASVRDRPVWQPMPGATEARFTEPLPQQPSSLEAVYDTLKRDMLPYPMGNIHPRFWMWYMGASNYTGALGDFLAAILGSNLGGGNHAAAKIDRQVVDWCKQMMGMPEEASGTLVSGGSMANLIGLNVARNVMAGADVRQDGVAAIPVPLRYYASDQVHSCHQKAMELLGLGNKALHRVASTDTFEIDIPALERAIAADRAAGLKPACVIANAGTVNTGAVDDLNAIADLCAREGLWFHVDGCIGALIALAPKNRHRVAGIERADSIALDPHKLLHAPFQVGCALVRDARAHFTTFNLIPEYLEMAERGVASSDWLHEYGPELSRGFRALKVWMALKQYGAETFGRLIDQSIEQAHHLAGLIDRDERLQLLTPVSINIVCYRYDPGGLSDDALKELNVEIMLRMQESGVAAVSDTTVHGQHCLRVAIANHRTRREDLDLLVRETRRIGDAIMADPNARLAPNAAE